MLPFAKICLLFLRYCIPQINNKLNFSRQMELKNQQLDLVYLLKKLERSKN